MRAAVRKRLEQSIAYHEAMAKAADGGTPNGENQDPRRAEQRELLARTVDMPEGEPQEQEGEGQQRGEDYERPDLDEPKLRGEGRQQQGEKRARGVNAQVHRDAAKQLRQLLDKHPETSEIERARRQQQIQRVPVGVSTKLQQAARDARIRYMQNQRRQGR
jgi:hypothetical protein